MVVEFGDERCRAVVLEALAKRGWQLVQDQTKFVEEICTEVRERGLGNWEQVHIALERTTIRHYCHVLHEACAKPGAPCQKHAFEELWRYLYPIALYKTHQADLAQECTQQALEKIWRKLSQCREPGSFLSWTTLILINEIREYYRGKGQREAKSEETYWIDHETIEIEMGRSDDAEEESKLSQSRTTQDNADLDRVITDETQRELLAIIVECIKNSQQQRILIESFFNDKGYKEIAEQLGITVGNVHVLRHRALLKLRKCDAFTRYIEEQLQ